MINCYNSGVTGEEFEELLEGSSLGAPRVKAVRQRTRTLFHPAEAWPRCGTCGERPESLRMPPETPVTDPSDRIVTLVPCGHPVRIAADRWHFG